LISTSHGPGVIGQPRKPIEQLVKANSTTNPKPAQIPSPAETILSLLRQDPDGKYSNAFEVLSQISTLRAAYEVIKSKPGNMVRGTTKKTLDGISLEEKASHSLRAEKFQWKPNRRVYIPKANGKRRPLGIASPRDKIIQQAMNMVMETVLEPKFHNSSHGFRPYRGCHTALREVRSWTGVPWIIEGDIKSFFDSINHLVLANLISKHFSEKRLLNLYWKLVKAGYVEFDKKKRTFITSDVGVPQGGIISPLLSNLVLHELDLYMEKLAKERAKLSLGQRPRIRNPAYSKLSYAIKVSRKNKDRAAYATAHKLRRHLRFELPNPLHSCIKYVRYADDWLVGVWGPKSLALELKSDIASFLQSLKLTLSAEKTLVTNTRWGKVKFLGTYIRRITPTRGSLAQPQAAGKIWMTAPMPILSKRLASRVIRLSEDLVTWGLWP